MKPNIHPEYREVAFVDLSINKTFIISSSVQTKETIEIDGKGNPTGINSVKNNTPLVADGVYTLDGTRVGTTLGDVQRGAYIVKFNGRTHKVIKR